MGNKTIESRQIKEKTALLEEFKKTPIVQVACKKISIGRATYYRWREEDINFAKNADQSLFEGSQLINDMAESQLISSIKDKNMTAIIYWLKHHHPIYKENTFDYLSPDAKKELIHLMLLFINLEESQKENIIKIIDKNLLMSFSKLLKVFVDQINKINKEKTENKQVNITFDKSLKQDG